MSRRRQFESHDRQQGDCFIRGQQRAGEADRRRRPGRCFHLGRPGLDGLCRPARPAHARTPGSNLLRNTLGADRAGVEQSRRSGSGRVSPSPPRWAGRSSRWPIPTACPPANMAEAPSSAWASGRSVEKQIARAENVRAALALVSRGEAPFGIVYSTDALADKGVKIVDTFPPGSYPPIVYPAALLASGKSPAAMPLLDYLRSAAARAIVGEVRVRVGSISACSNSARTSSGSLR